MRLFGHSDEDLRDMHALGVEHGRLMANMEASAKSTERFIDIVKRWQEGTLSSEDLEKEIQRYEAA